MNRAVKPRRVWGSLPGAFLVLLFSLPMGGSEPNLPAGLTYDHRVQEGPISVHVLTLDPRQIQVFAARALGDGVGRESVSSIARRNGALAGFNGGYFAKSERYDGDPTGMLKIGDAWYSTSGSPSSAIGWKADGSRTLIGSVAVKWRVRLGPTTHRFAGINRARGGRERILYSWAFHRSTLTDPGGLEVAIQNGKIVAFSSRGDCPIPVGGFVASFGPAVMADAAGLEQGMDAEVTPVMEAEPPSPPVSEWERMDYIIGGGPILLGPGSRRFGETDFAEKRHPRTAVGILPDGKWTVLAVDGRQPTVSLGMSLAELSATLESFGCTAGINLDGGGSTALYLNGKIVNSPSDFGTERLVSDAILVRARHP